MNTEFDVIIVGGGHAGCEAAAASARMGAKTALMTHKLETVGVMSCNPAIGGLGKGHLVREIDALDGIMGRIIDQAGIQFRMLNASKGPAVRGPRAQADRKLYKDAMQAELSGTDNLTLIGMAVEDLHLDDDGEVAGVIGKDGQVYKARAVVLTTGTFLRGMIFRGEEAIPAGRVGEAPTIGLAETLERLEFPLGRLKTGTPARLDGRTINWDVCEEQPGDTPPQPFSYLNDKINVPQIPCHITFTNEKTHKIIAEICTVPRCIQAILKVSVRAIAHPLKTRFHALPISPVIRFFWNRKGWTITPFTRTEFQPPYPSKCKNSISVRSRDWRMSRFWNGAMRLSTITAILGI